MPDFNQWDAYQFGFLALVIYREANNQSDEAMAAVGWVVKNRVKSPGWWGNDIPSVVTKHYQFSSFNWSDVNSQKFIHQNDLGNKILRIAFGVYWGIIPDNTDGATYYYDVSLDNNPPSWKDKMIHTADIGAFHFFKET